MGIKFSFYSKCENSQIARSINGEIQVQGSD